MNLETISVVLVEDHPVFRYGLRERLARESDIDVIGEAGTASEALALLQTISPAVVVLDLKLPDLSGPALVARLVEAAPAASVLILTMLDDDSVVTALRWGAVGYLLKDAEPERIVAAIRAAAKGETTISHVAARRLAEALPRTSRTLPADFPVLTARELEVLTLVSAGLTNADICRRLSLAPKTVRNYVSGLITKLGCTSRQQAAARARAAGLATHKSSTDRRTSTGCKEERTGRASRTRVDSWRVRARPSHIVPLHPFRSGSNLGDGMLVLFGVLSRHVHRRHLGHHD